MILIHSNYPSKKATLGAQSGFALIASLSIMAILVMIAVALYSMSAVATRSADIAAARTEAQANAKMALMMAIGELQKHTGPDTRVTAPADIVNSDPATPMLVGAWRSWEGLNHDPNTGRPVTPNYATKGQAYDPANPNANRFLAWLVSSANEGQNISDPESIAFVSAPDTVETIPLLTAGDPTIPTDGSLSDTDNGGNPREIHVVPSESEDGNRYAWWVSPENQKARLMQSYAPRSQDATGWSELAQSNSIPDPSVFGLGSEILSDPEAYNLDGTSDRIARKALNLPSIELLKDNNTAEPGKNYHDFSTTATGLLTNTATGGWRKDLSILSEKWDAIYSNYVDAELPLFRYSPDPGDTSAVPQPSESNYDPDQSVLFPWSDYTQIGADKLPSTYHTASASWQSLVNFATYYKNITYDAGTKIGRAPFGWKTRIRGHGGNDVSDEDFYRHYHELEVNPVVARVQIIVQANAIPDPDPNQTDPSLHYRVNLNAIPIVTLWNPYNVEIDKSLDGPYTKDRWAESRNADFGVGTQRSLPITLGIMNGTVPPANGFPYKLFNGGNSNTIDGATENYDYQIPENIALGYGSGDGFGTRSQYYSIRAVTAWLPLEFNLQPGEAKVFVPAFGRDGAWSGGVRLKEGFATGDDSGLTVVNPNTIDPDDKDTWKDLHEVKGRPGNQLHSSDLVRFSLKTDRFMKAYSDAISTKPGAGAYFSVGTSHWPMTQAQIDNGEVAKGATHIRSNMVANPDMDWATKYWPSDELQEVQRTVDALDPNLPGNPPWTNIFSISFGPRLTIGEGDGNAQNRATKGVLQSSPFAENTYSIPEDKAHFHPANTAYDLSYSTMSSNSELSPEVGTEGYIVSGFQSGGGLSRLIMAEIPLKPMASLVELQSWNLRGKNPLPPFQYNLIGNSDATPLIEQSGILPSDPYRSDVAENLQHDDAYCANHLLFDDWFFSSIAPQPTNFGSNISKDIETVYKEYLDRDLDLQLANRAYQPIPEDRDLSATDAFALADSIINSSDGDGWLKVASRFVVDGMFNVNSTSVKAWRALLGHAREQEVAHHTANGIVLDNTKRDHVVSRHTVAADVLAGEDQGMGAAFPDGSEYAGFRSLSDDQLDELARLIVEQIKVRGPFLSLSEFINRQLSTSTVDLPLAGDGVNLALAGALQTALNRLSEDPLAALKNEGANDQLSSETMDPSDTKLTGVGYAFEQAAEGFSTHGLPGWIRQADILRPIAPILSARDDTFTIRAYGDKRDAAGNVIARAWCEATVQRSRDYVDPVDEADFIDTPTSEINRLFGRKYTIKSFRWLNEDEV